MVHRVDGPIGVYRGFDDGTDRSIAAMNAELAEATILQSRYSLEKHRELGLELREPTVVSNAVDPAIFHPPSAREPIAGRKVRVIATSWSDNVRKGAETLAWLDAHLDRTRYELTFVGRGREHEFERVRSRRPGLVRRGRAAAPRARCLSRAQPRRSVLERAARGARVRSAGRLSRERRAPRARERGRTSVRLGRGDPRRPRPARRGARRASRRRSRCLRSPPSPTGTSRCWDWKPRIARPWRTTSSED